MELKWTLQYSQTVWSPRGTPEAFGGFCFLGFVERFFQTLLETAWPLLIGVSVSESLVPRLTVGSRQALCVLYAAGPVLSWGSWLGVRRTVQIRGA